jgi:hypothetical protein
MGDLGRDSQGNLRFLKTIRKDALVAVPIDRRRRLVNEKGYLIDKAGNVINYLG